MIVVLTEYLDQLMITRRTHGLGFAISQSSALPLSVVNGMVRQRPEQFCLLTFLLICHPTGWRSDWLADHLLTAAAMLTSTFALTLLTRRCSFPSRWASPLTLVFSVLCLPSVRAAGFRPGEPTTARLNNEVSHAGHNITHHQCPAVILLIGGIGD